MPASPAEPLPRRKLSKTVSAWSSAVCATSTAVAPCATRAVSRASYRAARARASRLAPPATVTRRASNPAPNRAARSATTLASRSLPGRRLWSTCTAMGASPSSSATARSTRESAPPEHPTTTGAMTSCGTSSCTGAATEPSSGCGGRAARPGAGIEEHTLSEQREELVGALETELPPDAAKARVHVAATDAELLRDGGDRRAGGERLEELSLLRGELADPLARSTDAGRGTGRRRRMLEAGDAHARLRRRAVGKRARLLVAGECLERLGLHFQPQLPFGRRRRGERLLEELDERPRIERLRDVLQRALDPAAEPRLRLVGRGHHEHRDLRQVAPASRLELLENGPTVGPGHAHVEEQRVGRLVANARKRFVAVGSRDDAMPCLLEIDTDELANVRFVVDDENEGHCRPRYR